MLLCKSKNFVTGILFLDSVILRLGQTKHDWYEFFLSSYVTVFRNSPCGQRRLPDTSFFHTSATIAQRDLNVLYHRNTRTSCGWISRSIRAASFKAHLICRPVHLLNAFHLRPPREQDHLGTRTNPQLWLLFLVDLGFYYCCLKMSTRSQQLRRL